MTFNFNQIDKKFLTIGIPTYNRVHTLQRLLRSLEELQSPWLELGIITILISDNHSTDSTGDFIKNHKLSSYIDYSINDKNIGAGKNMLKITNMFDSNYLMMIGDDDIILLENLVKLIQELWLEKPDYALINLKNITGFNTINSNEQGIFQNVIQNSLVNVLGYFGCIIISDKLRNYLSLNGCIFGIDTYWPSIELFFKIPSSFKGILVLNPPIQLIADAVRWEVEDWFEISRVHNLKFLNKLYTQSVLTENDYDALVLSVTKKQAYIVIFAFLFGKNFQKTKISVKYILAHFYEKISSTDKIVLLSISRFPIIFNQLLRPLNIFFYYIIYKKFYVGFLNLFRKEKKKDMIAPFINNNKPNILFQI